MANRTCIIHKEKIKKPFISINKEHFISIVSINIDNEYQEETNYKDYQLFTKGELILYLYLIGNENGFKQGMNYENTGLDKSTYQRAFKSLERKGYLIQREDNQLFYDFYEKSIHEKYFESINNKINQNSEEAESHDAEEQKPIPPYLDNKNGFKF